MKTKLHKREWTIMASIVLASTIVASPSLAVEIQLRRQCQPASMVVTLGDVADVFSNDPQEVASLSAVELVTAPMGGSPRYVSVVEIQDLLRLRQVSLRDIRFSGSSQVAVHGQAKPSTAPSSRSISSAALASSERRATEAITAYLRENVSSEASWAVRPQLNSRQAQSLLRGGRNVTVCGGQAPWEGTQQFEIAVNDGVQSVRFTVQADVQTRPAVVVTTRSIGRGEKISAGDVRLAQVNEYGGAATAFHSLSDVIGKEAERAIGFERIVGRDEVRQEILVRRNDVVTVYVQSGRIVMRLQGRAQEDGGLDESIEVEPIHGDPKARSRRQATFTARVADFQTVVVLVPHETNASRSAGHPQQSDRTYATTSGGNW